MEEKIHQAVEKHYTQKRNCATECIEISKCRLDARDLKKSIDDRFAAVENKFKWGVVIFAVMMLVGVLIVLKENNHDSRLSFLEAGFNTFKAEITHRVDIQRDDIRELQKRDHTHESMGNVGKIKNGS